MKISLKHALYMFLQNISRAIKTLWGLIISIFIPGIQTNLAMTTSLLHNVLLPQSLTNQAN